MQPSLAPSQSGYQTKGVGDRVGAGVGDVDGVAVVGEVDGADVGDVVGDVDGAFVGEVDGADVGMGATKVHSPSANSAAQINKQEVIVFMSVLKSLLLSQSSINDIPNG